MTGLNISPEQAVALMRQERLQHIAARTEADDKIRTLDAQLAGALLAIDLRAKADAALAAASAEPADLTEQD